MKPKNIYRVNNSLSTNHNWLGPLSNTYQENEDYLQMNHNSQNESQEKDF